MQIVCGCSTLFSVAVIKYYLQKKKLGKRGFILAYSCICLEPIMVEETWKEEYERKKRV